MTEGERRIIILFAHGDRTLRDSAIAIHRDSMRKYGLMRNDPIFDFMSEVDNPCPDLNLRARYRAQVKRLKIPKILTEPQI